MYKGFNRRRSVGLYGLGLSGWLMSTACSGLRRIKSAPALAAYSISSAKLPKSPMPHCASLRKAYSCALSPHDSLLLLNGCAERP